MAFFWATWNDDTGALLDLSDSEPEIPELPLKMAMFRGDMPDLATQRWDRGTKSFYPKDLPLITRLAFRNRFTSGEKEAISDLIDSRSQGGPGKQLKIFLEDIASAQFIDLSRSDTIGGVQMLEAGGIIGAGRANEILTDPIGEDEAYRK